MSAGKLDLYFMQCKIGKLTKILGMFVMKLSELIMKNNCVGS